MSKNYSGWIKKDPKNMTNPEAVVEVGINDEYGHMKKTYKLEPAPPELGFYRSHGFAWGYEGSGPQDLAKAILFDYTGQDVKKTNKYFGALLEYEIKYFDGEKGFIINSENIEAAMRFADRQREAREREEKKQQRRFKIFMWRRNPRLALGALRQWAEDVYSKHQALAWIIALAVGVAVSFALWVLS